MLVIEGMSGPLLADGRRVSDIIIVTISYYHDTYSWKVDIPMGRLVAGYGRGRWDYTKEDGDEPNEQEARDRPDRRGVLNNTSFLCFP